MVIREYNVGLHWLFWLDVINATISERSISIANLSKLGFVNSVSFFEDGD